MRRNFQVLDFSPSSFFKISKKTPDQQKVVNHGNLLNAQPAAPVIELDPSNQSVTFMKILTQMNIRIYSYKQKNYINVWINICIWNCTNISIFSNICLGFTLEHIHEQMSIYSYKQIWHKWCPNIFVKEKLVKRMSK